LQLGRFVISARDSRGSYRDDTPDALKAEMESRGEQLEWVAINVDGVETPEATRSADVTMYAGGLMRARLESSNEAIVAHLNERVRALFEQAAVRRSKRLEAEHAQQESVEHAHTPAEQGLRKWLRHPWVVGIGAAVIGGLILWLIFYLV
jgi:hypothetical protein